MPSVLFGGPMGLTGMDLQIAAKRFIEATSHGMFQPVIDRHAHDASYQVGYPPAASLTYTRAQVEQMRLAGLREQQSHYGRPIPAVWGKMRFGGNILWAGDFYVADANSFLPPPSVQPAPGDPIPAGYVWRADVAILLCRGPVNGVACIWADDTVIYAAPGTSATVGTGFSYYSIAIYHGNEAQTPDGTMSAALGAGNVPAYRGSCYVVIRGLDLTRWGNRLPTFSFVVHTSARGSVQIKAVLEDVAGQCGLTADDYDFTAATDYT